MPSPAPSPAHPAPGASHRSPCGSCASSAVSPTVPLSISAPSAPRSPSTTPTSAPTPNPALNPNPNRPALGPAPTRAPTPDPNYLPGPGANPNYPPPDFRYYGGCPDLPESALVFNPTNIQAASIFRALSDPGVSLDDIARTHDVTFEALCVWMARPDISARLDVMEQSAARHVRMATANYLPQAAAALVDICRAFTYVEHHVPLPPNTEAREQRRRQSTETRKASWLLYRIVRYHAGPPSPRSPGRSAEARRGDEGSRSELTHIGTPINTPAPRARQLDSLPPLHTVAEALQDLLARAAANRAARENGSDFHSALDSGAEFQPTPHSGADFQSNAPVFPPSPRSPGRGPEALRGGEGCSPNLITAPAPTATTPPPPSSRGAAPASSPGREPRVDRPISPSPGGAPAAPLDHNAILNLSSTPPTYTNGRHSGSVASSRPSG